MPWWGRALAGAALLGVGFVAGLVVGDSSAPSQTLGTTAPATEAPGAGESETGGVERSPGVTEARPRRERDRADAGDTELAPAVGNGVITAVVRTPAGVVLPDVRVVLEARPDAMPGYTRPGVEGMLDRDPEELIASYAALTRWRHASRVEATTDATGEVRFEGLPPLRYQVYAVAEGYDVSRGGRHDPIEAGDRVELLAKPVVTLALDVRLPDGTQPELGNVRAERANHTRSYSWRPELPELRMEPGRHEISVSAEDHGAKFTVELAEGVTPTLRRVDLQPRSGIRVTIRSSDGVLPELAYVFIARLKPGTELGPSAFANAEHSEHVRPRRSAEMTQWDLPPGEYAVGCAFAWNHPPSPVVYERVVLGAALAETELLLPAFDETNTVQVRVVDAAGEPVPEAQLGLKVVRGNSTHSGGATIVDTRDGIQRVVRPTGSFDHAVLKVVHAEYGTYQVEFGPDHAGVLEVVLRHPARLRVTVPGMAASPYADRLDVQLVPVEDRVHPATEISREVSAREGDTFAERLVAPGRYRLRLVLRRDRWRVTTLSTQELELGSGEREYAVALPALYELRVTGPADSAGQTVQLTRRLRDDGQGEQWTSAGRATLPESGPVVLDGLPAGRYRVTLDGGTTSREINLPGDHDVRF